MLKKVNSPSRQFGTALSVLPLKGYGFLISDARVNHFFHFRELVGGKVPRPGEQLSYIPAEDDKGRVLATNVAVEPANDGSAA